MDEETVSSDRGGPGERRSLKFKIVSKHCNSEIQNDILHTDTLIKKVYICSL